MVILNFLECLQCYPKFSKKVAVKNNSKCVPGVGLSAVRWVVKWNTIKALQF